MANEYEYEYELQVHLIEEQLEQNGHSCYDPNEFKERWIHHLREANNVAEAHGSIDDDQIQYNAELALYCDYGEYPSEDSKFVLMICR
jgi:hypothetical protein